MSSRVLILIAIIFLTGSIKCQDVAVPNDLLPTDAPSTTKVPPTTTKVPPTTTSTTKVPFTTTSTTEVPFYEETTLSESDENGDDNLVEWRTKPPLIILPPSDDDCDLPTQSNPAPFPVPPIYHPSTDKPEKQIISKCPIGFIQNGTRCVQEYSHNCPSGYEWKSERCVLSQIVCPLNYEFDGGKCVERQICPPNHVWENNRCVQPEPQCPLGFRWTGLKCEVSTIQCQPGSILRGTQCVIESISCPSGFTLVNNQCIKPIPTCQPGYELQESGFCEKTKIQCPEGSILINGECQRVTIQCPPGTQQIGNQCYERTTTQRPIFNDPSPGFPQDLQQICPEGFRYYKGQCYRCPVGYSFCRGKCVRTPKNCENSGNIPPLNINININFSRPHFDSNSHQREPVNIINNIEPVNNTIVNINNVTHPVTLNNVVENNIYIYNEVECEDGTIRTTVVKNNETITSCTEASKKNSKDKNEKLEGTTESNLSNEEGEDRCCEIVTPRECKKRAEDQWICTHRRYKYCGKFCIADRLYMRPQTTSYNNQILTMAPAPQNYWRKPCYGGDCPPVDCAGCMNGSFDCSPQCYTYPCPGNFCTYIDADDFCENVGGSMCR